MVDLLHVVVAGFVFLKMHAPAIELLYHRERSRGIGHQCGLVDNAVVGDGDFLHVLLGSGVAGHNGVVEAVHAHGDGAGTFDIGFLEQHDVQAGVLLLGGDRRHRAGSAAANHQNVGFDHRDVIYFHGALLFPVYPELIFE